MWVILMSVCQSFMFRGYPALCKARYKLGGQDRGVRSNFSLDSVCSVLEHERDDFRTTRSQSAHVFNGLQQ